MAFASDQPSVWTAEHLSQDVSDRLPEEVLAPIIAGAYARGIADGLDALGLAGLFLDGGGRVIFANGAAGSLLRGTLRVRTGHLVADGLDDNRLLADLVAEAVSGIAGGLRSCTLPHARLTLHAIHFGDRSTSAGQLLRAILLIDDGRDSCVAAAAERMATMSRTSPLLSA